MLTLGNYWGRDQAMVLYAQYAAISISKVKVQPVSTLWVLCQLSSILRESVEMRDTDEICALSAFWAASPGRGPWSKLCLGWLQTWELGSVQSGFLKALGCRCLVKSLSAVVCQTLPICCSFETHFIRPIWHFVLKLVAVLVGIGCILCYLHKYNWSALPCCHKLTIFTANWLFCMAHTFLSCWPSLSGANVHFASYSGYV